jgi:hypothetical protein
MRCLILHVSGDRQHVAKLIAEAINQFAAANAVHADGFTAYFADKIVVASTRIIEEADIATHGAPFCIVDAIGALSHPLHHIFVDCEEPKITVAGWYDRPFQFGVYFPRCNGFGFLPREHRSPLLREAQFYISVLLGNNFSLKFCSIKEEPLEPKKSCGHAVGPIRFVWTKDMHESCASCLRGYGSSLHVFGEYTDTEYTRTGAGFRGKNDEYVVVSDGEIRHSLVDKIIVIKPIKPLCF